MAARKTRLPHAVLWAALACMASGAGALAQSAGARNCEAISDPHRYNLCLAASGPAARRGASPGAGARPGAGDLAQDLADVEADARAWEAPRSATGVAPAPAARGSRSNSQYLNLGAPAPARATRAPVRIPRR